MKRFILFYVVTLFSVSLFAGNKYLVTSTESDVATAGTFAWCYEQVAAADDTIGFNVAADEITLPATVVMKSMCIDGLNRSTDKLIILKRDPSRNFFTLASGITATLKNLVLNGENIVDGIGITTVFGSALNIENCVMKNINSGATTNNGGVIRAQGVLNIKNSLFENNTSGNGAYGGGAICLYNAAEVMIENSSFIGNKALAGGAIAAKGTVANPLSLKIYNCTFANNEASLDGTDRRGGALYLNVTGSTGEVNAVIVNSTVTGNYAINNGGGLCAFAAAGKKVNINLINNIITNNKTGSASDIDAWNLNDRVYFPVASNNIYGTLAGSATGIAWTNSTSANTGIFDSVEEFVAGFERPVLSEVTGMKVAKLSEASIARNAGIAVLDGFTIPTTDQLGKTRPATPSIGAVEYIASPTKIVLPQKDSEINISVKGRDIVVSGVENNAVAQIYNLMGMQLKTQLISDNGVISVWDVPGNIFIAKIGNKTFKLIVK